MIDEILIGLFVFFFLLSSLFIILILSQKRRHENKNQKVQAARAYLFKKYFDQEEITSPVSNRFFLDALLDVNEQIQIDEKTREQITNDLLQMGYFLKQIKKIKSKNKLKRRVAAQFIGLLPSDAGTPVLMKQFAREKDESVRLSILFAMRNNISTDQLKTIMDSLLGSTLLYQERLAVLLGNYCPRINDLVQQYREEATFHFVYPLVRICSFHQDNQLIAYQLHKLDWIIAANPFDKEKNILIKERILKNILEQQPNILTHHQYINHPDSTVREFGISSLAYQPTIQTINLLIDRMDGSEQDEVIVKTISKIVLRERILLDHIIRIFSDLNPYQQRKMAVVCAERIDYIVLKAITNNKEILNKILNLLFELKLIEPLIDFLNTNEDKAIEQFLLSKIQAELSINQDSLEEFRVYLKPHLLQVLGLQSYAYPAQSREKVPPEKKKISWMIKWIAFALLLFPLIYIGIENIKLLKMNFPTIILNYILDVNIYLIFYFFVINLIYIILFILALAGSRKQMSLSRTMKYSFLFTNQLLPGISIIAPAYNEEISIIESVTSLLNLKYPTYEVIVVNDGSKDETLKKLIDHFQLERKHSSHQSFLETKKIRGIYTTKDIPNLVVVDKQNGGKADALNVGINVSKLPYVCGIDADSILESNALLRLASSMFEDTKPTIAMGGNIYPANGFVFDRGQVQKRAIPQELVCRLQTIEYLRAFTSGRIGWSEAKSLMIISGAFGLFQKEALIEAGGYLTSSGVYKKDTVGEDMELVVRLTRLALEKKAPYRVSYVSNAYCYTELPSDWTTLLKQRNRWQRGLIDILSFHRDIAFRPTYKQIGSIGYGYFFIFEFVGPFLEAIGYFMVLLAAALGLLYPTLLLAIFVVSVAFGVVISLSSLFMSEKELLMMSRKETWLLLGYAILENFGYRQLISLHRVYSTFSALKETGQWGTQKRKGFKT